MPLVPVISVTNNNIVTSQFTVNDLSTGSDAAIANRLIFIYDYQNNLFTGAPIQFPLSAGGSITPNILTQDFAFNCVVQWVDASGNVLYTTSQIGVFTGFLEWFEYGLSQQIAAQPNLLNDINFFNNWSKLRTFIDGASNAITIAGSIYNSQSMIQLAQYIVNNQAYNF